MASSKPETDRAERNAVKAPITSESRATRRSPNVPATTTKGGKTATTKRMDAAAADTERARRAAARAAGEALEDAHDDDSDIVSGAVPEQTPASPGGGVEDVAREEGGVEINTSGAVYETSFPEPIEGTENKTGTVKAVIANDTPVDSEVKK